MSFWIEAMICFDRKFNIVSLSKLLFIKTKNFMYSITAAMAAFNLIVYLQLFYYYNLAEIVEDLNSILEGYGSFKNSSDASQTVTISTTCMITNKASKQNVYVK